MGIASGIVYTSVVGSNECKDYSVMGDAVNLGARLQDKAGPGDILVSEEVYRSIEDEHPDAKELVLDLKGIKGRFHACSLTKSNSRKTI